MIVQSKGHEAVVDPNILLSAHKRENIGQKWRKKTTIKKPSHRQVLSITKLSRDEETYTEVEAEVEAKAKAEAEAEVEVEAESC